MADAEYWIPAGNKRRGMTAVAVSATVSLVFLSALLVYIASLLYRYRTRSRAERVEKETRAIRFLASHHGIIFFSLLAGDLLQALGFSMTYQWLRKGAVPAPAHPTALCTAQAVLIQVGDIGSAFSSLIMCGNLFCIIVLKINPSLRIILAGIGFTWISSGVLAGAGPAAFPRPDDGSDPAWLPFYGNVGGWCWISGAYQRERLTLHYLYVFITALVTCVLYTFLAALIGWQRRQLDSDAPLTRSSAILLIYPAVYVATILPISVYRCAAMDGHNWDIQYALAGGAVFTMSGAANCIVYALTRHIVSLEGIGSALRRGSGSGRSFDLRRLSSVFTTTTHHRPSLPLSLGSFATPPRSKRPSVWSRLWRFLLPRQDGNAATPVPAAAATGPPGSGPKLDDRTRDIGFKAHHGVDAAVTVPGQSWAFPPPSPSTTTSSSSPFSGGGEANIEGLPSSWSAASTLATNGIGHRWGASLPLPPTSAVRQEFHTVQWAAGDPRAAPLKCDSVSRSPLDSSALIRPPDGREDHHSPPPAEAAGVEAEKEELESLEVVELSRFDSRGCEQEEEEEVARW